MSLRPNVVRRLCGDTCCDADALMTVDISATNHDTTTTGVGQRCLRTGLSPRKRASALGSPCQSVRCEIVIRSGQRYFLDRSLGGSVDDH